MEVEVFHDGGSYSVDANDLDVFHVELQVASPTRWVSHPFVYPEYIEAVIWAMMLSDSATGVLDVRVVDLTAKGNII